MKVTLLYYIKNGVLVTNKWVSDWHLIFYGYTHKNRGVIKDVSGKLTGVLSGITENGLKSSKKDGEK